MLNFIHVLDNNCALLDCGEDTLGQLIRFNGRAGADKVIKNPNGVHVAPLWPPSVIDCHFQLATDP